jgi:CCR4-NOT complex subunit CAF16
MQGTTPERRKKIVDVLDIDETWRMHRVSDGQRRRVQIACGLLRPAEVLLLDEVTVSFCNIPLQSFYSVYKLCITIMWCSLL